MKCWGRCGKVSWGVGRCNEVLGQVWESVKRCREVLREVWKIVWGAVMGGVGKCVGVWGR